MSDWRDPLDPDSETQMIYSQLLLGKEELETKLKKYRETQTPVATNGIPSTQCNVEQSKSTENHNQDDDYFKAASQLLDALNEIEQFHKLHAKGEEFTFKK